MAKAPNKTPNPAVLLAAGFGKRLFPHTRHTPKPLLTADNKPIIDYVFNALKAANLRNILMVTNYHGDQIISHTKKRFGKSFQITFCHQPRLDGTAGALRCAVEWIRNGTSDDFLITATDYQMPVHYLKTFIQFHSNGSQDVSVALRKIAASKVKESNITRIDQHNSIISISEKPRTRLTDGYFTASYLLYLLPRQSLDYLNRVQPSKRGEYELPELINRMIKAGFKAKGYFDAAFPEWEKKYVAE